VLAANIMAAAVDVSRIEDVSELETAVRERSAHRYPDEQRRAFSRAARHSDRLQDCGALSASNLWGVVHGSQIFAPGMIERGRPGLIINTGSKQGSPPLLAIPPTMFRRQV